MVRGLYIGCTGMINEQRRMDILTNNLANANTTGFKKEGSTSEAFSSLLAYKIKDTTQVGPSVQHIGNMSLGVKIGEAYTDFAQGSFKTTENTFDIALSGEGFFAVEFTGKDGETSTRYTRDGAFSMTTDGYLTTCDGDYVLGVTGNGAATRIQIDPNAETTIDQSGTIWQNRQAVGQLMITDFEDYNYLSHYGENYYVPVEGAQIVTPSAKVFQGYLEASNVNVVDEMVEMISVTRAYETNQKIIQAMDETLDKAVNDVGRV